MTFPTLYTFQSVVHGRNPVSTAPILAHYSHHPPQFMIHASRIFPASTVPSHQPQPVQNTAPTTRTTRRSASRLPSGEKSAMPPGPEPDHQT